MLELVSQNLEIFVELGLMLVFAFLIRQAIIFNNQLWTKTFSSSLTLVLLPVITYGVTSVISGNIALSLGLVGALSIVRFRNPVRSSFELSVFFLYISLGITASASIKYLILLGATSLAALIGAGILNRLYKKLTGRSFFEPSFAEANHVGTLEANFYLPHDNLETFEEFLTGVYDLEAKAFSYRFTSEDFNKLKSLKAELVGYDGLQNIRLSQV